MKPFSPDDASDVTVTFTDGEVKVYRISAGPTIGGWLAREAGANGVLSLFNRDQAWGIPLSSVRDWSIATAPKETPIKRRRKDDTATR